MPCHDCLRPVRRPASNSQSGFRNDLPDTVQVHCSPWLVTSRMGWSLTRCRDAYTYTSYQQCLQPRVYHSSLVNICKNWLCTNEATFNTYHIMYAYRFKHPSIHEQIAQNPSLQWITLFLGISLRIWEQCIYKVHQKYWEKMHLKTESVWTCHMPIIEPNIDIKLTRQHKGNPSQLRIPSLTDIWWELVHCQCCPHTMTSAMAVVMSGLGFQVTFDSHGGTKGCQQIWTFSRDMWSTWISADKRW